MLLRDTKRNEFSRHDNCQIRRNPRMKNLRPMHCLCAIAFGLILLQLSELGNAQSPRATDWPNYGNDPGGMRYSPLTQLNRDTVSQLKVAWVFHTGDISEGNSGQKRSGFETTPILVDGTLYLTTPFNRVIALDPVTGKQRWAYNPEVDRTLDYGDGLINRGVATWRSPSSSG